MRNAFEQHVRLYVEISDCDLETIYQKCIIRTLRKWQPVLQVGETWKLNCFIVSGCCRLYRISEDGSDHTLRFAIDNWWISDQESYNNEKASEYNIESLATSTALIWTKEQWSALMDTIPALKKFNEILLAKSYEASQRRIYSLISYPAERKYTEFRKTYPGIFNRVPLYMIASYLGISRETLSRIRKQDARHP